jgi:crotonobetainyl-CoA:carnitine CoA-transferase CaiB-like acyl-CoA transferase
MSSQPLPLAGRMVLDLTRNVAGPYATMILADLGADVVKVEQPISGDDTRQWGPPFWHGESAMFLALNRNKRSVSLDLRDGADRERLAALARRADVLVESFRPGYLEGLGLGPEWARALNPALVYCSISGFGAVGPRAPQAAYDPLIQAFSGQMGLTGEPGGGPVRMGVAPNDMGTGIWAALGILAALVAPHPAEAGRHVRVSLYETALSFMSYHLAGTWAGAPQPRRMGTRTYMIAPYETFESRDGHVMICAGNNKLFQALCGVLGCPALAQAPEFADNPTRVANRDALHDVLEARTRTYAAEELVRSLDAAGVPASEIRDLAEVSADAQAEALGMFQEIAHPAVGTLRSVALPLTFDGERPPLRRPPPLLGEHGGEVAPAPDPKEAR